MEQPLWLLLFLYYYMEVSFLSNLLIWIYYSLTKNHYFFLLSFILIIEELAFRGVIQEYIATKTKQYPNIFYFSLANILTSILFVLMHFVHHLPVWALLVFVPSLVFGYFKEQYNHIVPSIVLHMFYNVCSIFILI